MSGAAGGTHVIEALNATVTKVTQLPGLGERDKAFSYEVVGPAFPFDMAQRIQEESVEWADLIKLAAISAQN